MSQTSFNTHRQKTSLRTLFLGLSLSVGPLSAAVQPFSSDQIDFFEKQIRPLLAENCYDCHNGKHQESGLRLDTHAGILRGTDYYPVAVPGNPAESKLLKALRHEPGVVAMPHKKPKLKDEDIAKIEKWLAMGMPWPEEKAPLDHSSESWKSHWAFQTVTAPEIPPADPQQPQLTPLDRLVAKQQHSVGLSFAEPADRRSLGRRLYLTITGLQPSYEQLQAYVNDTDPKATQKLIDQLLNSPQYGERWARHWLDVARYADTEGYRAGDVDIRFPFAFTYRDWVIKALNDDMPYDQFIIHQLAADHLIKKGETSPNLAALGFLTVNDSFMTDGILQADDRLDTMTRGILGLTVSCARCHDHKYDPISAKDYYALFGILYSSEVPKELPIIAQPTDEAAIAAYKAEVEKIEAERHKRNQEIYDDVRNPDKQLIYFQFAHLHRDTEEVNLRGESGKAKIRPQAARRWINFFKKHQTDDKVHPALIVWNRFAKLPADQFAQAAAPVFAELTADNSPALPFMRDSLRQASAPQSFNDVAKLYNDWLQQSAQEGNLNAEDWKTFRDLFTGADSPLSVAVADVRVFHTTADNLYMTQLNNKLRRLDIDFEGAPIRAMVMVDREKPYNERIMIRGNAGRRGDVVPRGNISLLGGDTFDKNGTSGRLELAQQFVSKDNPLAARVMVNRVWLQHFDKPLVDQPSDFGVQTAQPIQHELLDYLAAELMANNWSLKHLHRLILNSYTFQQGSVSTAEKDLKDAENLYLTRQNRRRLDYEAMRDSMLKVAEDLDTQTVGGRPVPLNHPKVDTRRSIYLFVDRYLQASVPAIFDFANPDAHSPQRLSTSVPQQALFLMNSPFTRTRADHLSEKVQSKEAADLKQQITNVYQKILLRDPNEKEFNTVSNFINDAKSLQNDGPPPYDWSYGWVEVSKEAVEGPYQFSDLKPLKHYKKVNANQERWNVAEEYPHPKHGYIFLARHGGNRLHAHAGRDNEATVIQWRAPYSAVLRLSGELAHGTDAGDGVRGLIVSSKQGVLANHLVKPKQKHLFSVSEVAVEKDEIISFTVLNELNDTSDSYSWTPVIEIQNSETKTYSTLTHSAHHFIGPDNWPLEMARPQDILSQLAQVLMISNEFQFID